VNKCQSAKISADIPNTLYRKCLCLRNIIPENIKVNIKNNDEKRELKKPFIKPGNRPK